MGLVYDLIVYAILLIVFLLRKEKAKRISLLFFVIYSSIACLIYVKSNIGLLIVNVLVGSLSTATMFLLEGKTNDRTETKKSKTLSGLLSLFFGSFGAHSFYLGRWSFACLYILFFWTLIPLFVSIIEGIIILVLPKQIFEKIYLSKSDIMQKDCKKKNQTVDYVNTESTNHHDNNKVLGDTVNYTDISLHETKYSRKASIKGTIEKFTITIETEDGPIHFLVENGLITSYYLETKKLFKKYEVN